MKKTAKSIIAVILCAAISAAAVLPLAGCGEQKKYEAAAALAEKGDWQSARSAFAELADYEDAADQVTRCDYQIAKSLMDGEDYESAEKMFEALNGYEDSAELLTQCRYNIALGLFEEEKYEEADAIFSTMTDYEESNRYNAVCRLKYDADNYIYETVARMNEIFKQEDMPIKMIEGKSSNSISKNFYVIPEDEDAPDIYSYFVQLIFENVGEDGKGQAMNGSVNRVRIFGMTNDGKDESGIDMTTSFIASSVVITSVLTGEGDYEKLLNDFNDGYTAMLEELKTNTSASLSDEYMGFSREFYSDYYKKDSSNRYTLYIDKPANG